MPPTLTTDRLTLRSINRADVTTLHRIYSHSRAMRYMPRPPHPDPETTWRTLSQAMDHKGAAFWAVCVTAEGSRPVGVVNYLGGTALPGLGYIVHPAYWGRGIATEACRAALDHGFSAMGHDRVELWIDERNHASRRVAEKLGFLLRGRLTQKYEHEPDAHVMLVYGMWATEWHGDPAPAVLRAFSLAPVLPVSDITASLAFYTDALGFRVTFTFGQPPDYAGVTLRQWSGTEVELHLAQAPADQTNTPAGQVFITVDGAIDALYERVRAADVTIIAPMESQPWGMREFTLTDPDGHRLRFAAYE